MLLKGRVTPEAFSTFLNMWPFTTTSLHDFKANGDK